jgi:hypothetical protein
VTKSSNHTLSLHRPTSYSSSPTNFPRLSSTENSELNSVRHSSFFNVTPLHESHGKHRILLLRMHVYSYVVWQQTSYSSVLLLSEDSIEKTQFPYYCCLYSCLQSSCLATRWSNPLQYNSVNNANISIIFYLHNMFRPQTVIVRCLSYAKIVPLYKMATFSHHI